MAVALSIAIHTFGQGPVQENGQKPSPLSNGSVPKVVSEKFDTEYPATTPDPSWYGCPAQGDEYWYGYNPYVCDGVAPEYYAVEFTKGDTLHKVVYTKQGKRIAVHRRWKELPKAVSEAIKKGKYKSWTITKDKEQIFNDPNRMKVYKVIVEKGTEKRALYFESNGTLMKEKKKKS